MGTDCHDCHMENKSQLMIIKAEDERMHRPIWKMKPSEEEEWDAAKSKMCKIESNTTFWKCNSVVWVFLQDWGGGGAVGFAVIFLFVWIICEWKVHLLRLCCRLKSPLVSTLRYPRRLPINGAVCWLCGSCRAAHLNSIRDKTATTPAFWRDLFIYKYWSDGRTPGESLNSAVHL